jgi:hypothetical protein
VGRAEDDLTASLLLARLIELRLPINVEIGMGAMRRTEPHAGDGTLNHCVVFCRCRGIGIEHRSRSPGSLEVASSTPRQS